MERWRLRDNGDSYYEVILARQFNRAVDAEIRLIGNILYNKKVALSELATKSDGSSAYKNSRGIVVRILSMHH